MKLRIYILLFLSAALISGCAAGRRSTRISPDDSPAEGRTLRYGSVIEGNIGDNGLFIRRLRLEMNVEGDRNRFTANLRKNDEGEWLLSVRSLLGIEVARIFADRSGVVILDRLSATAYVYNWDRLSGEYGVNYEMLPLLLGDTPDKPEIEGRLISCGVPVRVTGRTGPEWMITVDCETGRPVEIVVSEPEYGRRVLIAILGFNSRGGRFLPGEISMTENRGALQVKYTLEDIDINWNGTIGFSIPSNYKVNK